MILTDYIPLRDILIRQRTDENVDEAADRLLAEAKDVLKCQMVVQIINRMRSEYVHIHTSHEYLMDDDAYWVTCEAVFYPPDTQEVHSYSAVTETIPRVGRAIEL